MKLFTIPIICFLCPFFSWAHPIPDIPVIGIFEKNGSAALRIEVDPRCFAEDPEEVPFLQKEAFEKLDKNERKELLGKAERLIRESLVVKFGKGKWFLPDFKYDFFSKEIDNIIVEGEVIVVHGHYSKTLEQAENSFQIKALESAGYDLVFRNIFSGTPHKRVNVLWPGEESFILDVSDFTASIKVDEPAESIRGENEHVTKGGGGKDISSSSDTASTFYSFLRKGFVHVLPEGLDHILFVIGLFFFSRKSKPLLLQVTAFTIAHTITIALASLNYIAISPSIIEPLIALSIVYIAFENIQSKQYSHIRLLSIFFFGLIHGLGFAGVSSLDPDSPSFVSELFGFTIGVDLGQIAVIGLALILTFGVKKPLAYRKLVVIPGSVLIALIGAYWTIERIFF